jgi:hypothetical protein
MKSPSYYEFPLQKPTPGIPIAEGGTAYRRLTGALVHSSQSLRYHAEDSNGWGGNNIGGNSPLKTPGGMPFYLCLPPKWGSVSGDCQFSVTCATQKNLQKVKILLNTGLLLYRDACLNTLIMAPASLVNHPRVLVLPVDLGILGIPQHKQVGHLAWQCRELLKTNLQRRTLQSRRFQKLNPTIWSSKEETQEIFVEDIPLCLKYDNNKIYMYSVEHNSVLLH